MYMLYFFVVLNIIRKSFFTLWTHKVRIYELPAVDRILALLNDIYYARALKQFKHEEDLFARLVFTLRSSSILIEMTRRPEVYVLRKKTHQSRINSI